MNFKTVNFQTKDEIKIVGDFFSTEGGLVIGGDPKSILLLHILPGDRHDFDKFSELLFQNGYNVLSIDERGHGESEAWHGEMGSWQEFTGSDFDKMILDVEAGIEWLKNKIPETKIAIIGASIGANLAMIFGAKHQPEIVVGLSTGINYKGIKTEIASKNFRKNLLLVASKDDGYAFESSQRLFEMSKAKNKEFLKYESAGHGTRMFDAEPEIKQKILEFLSKNF